MPHSVGGGAGRVGSRDCSELEINSKTMHLWSRALRTRGAEDSVRDCSRARWQSDLWPERVKAVLDPTLPMKPKGQTLELPSNGG